MTEPQTEAGRRLHAELGFVAWFADDFGEKVAAIEAQARHAALADVRRGVEGLDRNRGLVALDEVGAILDAAETP